MKTSMFLPILLLSNVAAVGNAEIRKYAAVGSSFTFPPVNIVHGAPYDIRIEGSHTLIATYHDSESVRPPYKHRSNFSINGTELRFELRNLTKEDSKTYEQVENMKVVDQIRLYVIEPVNKPTLIVNETIDGSQCHVHLECSAQGADLLNLTFHKNGEEITGNVTRMGYSSFLNIDPLDPGSLGTYTCKASNPVGNKTSSEIPLLSTDNDKCKNATLNPPNIISIIIGVVIGVIIGFVIIIIIALILYRKCKNPSGEKTNPCMARDVESAETTPETSPLINKKPSEEEKSQDSSCIVPDPEEPGDMTLGNDQGGPTAENIPNCPDSGHCGQEDKSSVELKPLVSAPDGGQEAIG